MDLTRPNRRRFITSTSGAFAALAASGCVKEWETSAEAGAQGTYGYGPLVDDPAGFIDLPKGFSYRVISKLGDNMDDGGTVPDAADGMGCFDLGGGEIALVRNHELRPGQEAGAVLSTGYGKDADGVIYPGGTTTLVLDAKTLEVKHQHRSLAGTIRNCAGGITPWGSWLTCEEPGAKALPSLKNHGFVFEVPASARDLVHAVPLKAMGRFNHEAACVDPNSGIVYMTEDRDEGLLYRFIPNVKGELAKGGKLQALAAAKMRDTRNWDNVQAQLRTGYRVSWIDLEDTDAPLDDLRLRGAAKGACLFARGEGIYMGEGEFFFCCTSGGAKKLGQIFRLGIGRGNAPDRLELFFESTSEEQFNYGDNICVAPNGHIMVCEDQYTLIVDNYVRGIDKLGRPYPLARLHRQTEWAGPCFSPDGKTMFVNVYSPAATIAITGPWMA